MLCENCGKKNATSIFMSPNSNKIKYLCGSCYKELNSDVELENFAYTKTMELTKNKVCKSCGTSFSEFEKSGLFGCADCYKTFADYIKNNFLSMFKEQKYLGKKPNLYYVESEIKNLENLIEICLKNGDLQKATKYGKELERIKGENYDRL